MSKHLHICSEEDSMLQALQIMKTEQVHRVLVKDSAGKLVGIVSLADIARQLASVDDVALAVVIARAVARISELRPNIEVETARAAE